MNNTTDHYKGRFAPSATGPLHLGSLVTALACALETQQKSGIWFIRIDDIDRHRCSDQSKRSIRQTAQQFLSLYPPSSIYNQSDTEVLYSHTLDTLMKKSLVYQCNCSRKDIASWNIKTIHHCRNNIINTIDHLTTPLQTLRFSSSEEHTKQGAPSQILKDIVLYRREGYFSYHLSCVTNDAVDGVTHIIRGADLIEAELPQRQLIKALELSQPSYSYIPLVRHTNGQKLSKQNQALGVNTQETRTTLIQALSHFNWPTTLPAYTLSTPESLWNWAVDHWDLSRNCSLNN